MATNIMNLEARLKFSAGNLKSEVTKAKGDLKELETALKNAAKSIGTSQAANASKNVQAVRTEITRLLKEIDRLKAAGNKNLSETSQFRRADILGGSQRVSGLLAKGTGFEAEAKAKAKAEATAAREAANALREKARAAKDADIALERMFYQIQRTDGTIVDFSKHAITLRYALYDVAAVSRNIGNSMLQLTGAFVQAGVKQESAFTQVEKTLEGVNVNGVQKLKDGLVELSQTLPVAFQDVSQIAMLGSQLNVAQDQLIGFTDTVAKFSALSQMSAEDTAMGFGKIANVLGLVDKSGKISGDAMRYLGSAIVAVGYNAAATEAQIISTAKQIGAISTAAGISASDTIALSSALASLAIAPEEARGVTVQLFNEINKAATSLVDGLGTGSDRLKVFAEVAGMTQAEFAKAWKDKSSKDYFRTIGDGANQVKTSMNGATYAFEEFVSGLGKGYDVQKILAQIGLDGVRTSKGITALAKGFAGLEDQIAIARKNGIEGTFLDVAYAKVADDLNSKLIKIKNSFEAFMASGTDQNPFKQVLGSILDTINALLIGLQKFASNPVGSFIIGLTVAVTALLGAITSLGAMVLIAGGSMLAMRTAFASAAGSGLNLNNTFVRLIATMLGFNREQLASIAAAQAQRAALQGVAVAGEEAAVGMATASVAAKTLKWALAGTGIGLAVIAIASVVAGFGEMADAENTASNGASNLKGGLDEAQKGMVDATKQANALKSEIQELFDSYTQGITNSRKLDNALYSSGQAAKNASKDFNTNSQAVRDYEDTVAGVITAAVQLYGDNQGDLKAFLTQYLAYLQKTGLATAATVEIIKGALAGLKNVKASDIKANFETLDTGLKAVNSSAKETVTLLEIVQKALSGVFNTSAIYSSLRDLGGSVAGIGKSFSIAGEEGSAAMDALNSSIEAIVTNAKENPQKAANQLKALRQAMWNMGVTSKAAYVVIDKAISATGKKGKAAAADVKKYYNQLSAGLAAATKKDTRTIEDWAGEIAQVLGHAMDLRFGKTSALDDITSGWKKMRDAVDEAAASIDGINQSLDEMNANKSVLEYQYKIAVKYGDTLRANKIAAELKKINAEIKKAETDKKAAIEASTVTTDGNTESAISNRAALLDLATKYQAYLLALAKTTTNQSELNAKADEARAAFMEQGKKLGFADDELKAYANTITVDFKTAIANLPTDITLNLADTDPIVTAIATFVAKANAELAKITVVNLDGSTTTVDNNTGGQVNLSGGTGTSTSTGSAPATGATSPVKFSTGGSSSGASSSSSSSSSSSTSSTSSTPAAQQYYSGYFNGFVGAYPKSPDITNKAVSGGSWVYDMNNGLHSVSHAAIVASRAGKLYPSAGAIAAYLTAKQDIVSELIKQAKRNPVEQMLFSAGHQMALSNIYNNHKMKAFTDKYGLGFATGGYVSGSGGATSDSIPARLSNGEFVMRASAVRTYGADFMNALNQTSSMRPSYGFSQPAAAGSGSSMVYLSPEDRSLLRAAIDRPVNLYTETTKIAQAANEGNVLLARKGMK